MLVIINGYVELSQLHSLYYYIVAVDIGAAIAWGLIDGFTYAMSEVVARGNQVATLKRIQSAGPMQSIEGIIDKLDGTFLSQFNYEGRKNIASEILRNSNNLSVRNHKFITREDLAGLASILGIYLAAGSALSIPYLVLPDKLTAWLVSNMIGIGWLFYYGYTVGKIGGHMKILTGLLASLVGIAFLVISYFIYV